MIHFKEQKYEMALQYYDKAEKILVELYKQLEGEQTLRDYALLRTEQGKLFNRVFENTDNFNCLQNALYYLEEARQKWENLITNYLTYKTTSDIKNLADTYYDIGALYTAYAMGIVQNELDKALVYVDNARSLLKKASDYAKSYQWKEDLADYVFEYVLQTHISANWRENKGEREMAKALYVEAYNALNTLCEEKPDNQEYMSVRLEIETCIRKLQ